MKNFYYIFILVFLFPLNVSEAFGFAPLGSSDNPIYFQEVDNNSYRDEQQNLINRYGSSEFYSCMADIRGCSGDMSDPRNQSNCLAAIEYAFNRGVCGRVQPSLECDVGFTRVNSSCVKEEKETSTQECPYGYYLSGAFCLPDVVETEDETYQNEVVVTEESPTMKTERCKVDYGIFSIWSGKYDNNGNITCACLDGYDFINGGQTCELVPRTQKIVTTSEVENIANYSELPTLVKQTVETNYTKSDPEKLCKEKYGINGKYLSTKNGKIECGCTENYSLGSDGQCSWTVSRIGSDEDKILNATSAQTASLAFAVSEEDENNKTDKEKYVWIFAIISFGLIITTGLRTHFNSIVKKSE